jgi:hypothetical protein
VFKARRASGNRSDGQSTIDAVSKAAVLSTVESEAIAVSSASQTLGTSHAAHKPMPTSPGMTIRHAARDRIDACHDRMQNGVSAATATPMNTTPSSSEML